MGSTRSVFARQRRKSDTEYQTLFSRLVCVLLNPQEAARKRSEVEGGAEEEGRSQSHLHSLKQNAAIVHSTVNT